MVGKLRGFRMFMFPLAQGVRSRTLAEPEKITLDSDIDTLAYKTSDIQLKKRCPSGSIVYVSPGFGARRRQIPRVSAILVHIGPEGELMVGRDGDHRIYIAHLAGIRNVPVRVFSRHRQWQENRELAHRSSRWRLPSHLSRHASHPDRADLFDGDSSRPVSAR